MVKRNRHPKPKTRDTRKQDEDKYWKTTKYETHAKNKKGKRSRKRSKINSNKNNTWRRREVGWQNTGTRKKTQTNQRDIWRETDNNRSIRNNEGMTRNEKSDAKLEEISSQLEKVSQLLEKMVQGRYAL